MRPLAVRLVSPQAVCDAAIAATPTRKKARVTSAKKATEAISCGKSMVSGNMPVAERATEPSIRLAIPNSPSRLEIRPFLRPIAKVTLNTPTRTRPALNNPADESSTPRTLRLYSVQLNQGELETAINRTVRAIS